MPFDGVGLLHPPPHRGRIDPARVDPKWSDLWAKAEAVCVLNSHAGDGQGVYDHSDGTFLTKRGTDFGQTTNRHFGPTVDFQGAATNSALVTVTGGVKKSGSRPMTIGIMFSLESFANSFSGIYTTTASTNNEGFRIQTTTSGGLLEFVLGNIATPHTKSSLTAPFSYFACWTTDPDTSESYCYLHNLDTHEIESLSDDYAGTGFTTEGTVAHTLGNFNDWIDYQMDGQIAFSFASNVFIGDAGARAWADDPWGPLRMIDPVTIGKVPAAGGGLGIPIAAYHYNHNLGSNT